MRFGATRRTARRPSRNPARPRHSDRKDGPIRSEAGAGRSAPRRRSGSSMRARGRCMAVPARGGASAAGRAGLAAIFLPDPPDRRHRNATRPD